LWLSIHVSRINRAVSVKIQMARIGQPAAKPTTFRDWAGNETPFAREVAEAGLAHVIGDAAERAYRRGDALDKRRAMMEAWARWCEPKADAGERQQAKGPAGKPP